MNVTSADSNYVLSAVVIVVGLLILGGLYFGYLLRFRRAVLETEPGDVSVFKH
jgi:hypothetical protein